MGDHVVQVLRESCPLGGSGDLRGQPLAFRLFRAVGVGLPEPVAATLADADRAASRG